MGILFGIGGHPSGISRRRCFTIGNSRLGLFCSNVYQDPFSIKANMNFPFPIGRRSFGTPPGTQ
jgi:hypothetical protein